MSIKASATQAGPTIDPWDQTASLELLNQLSLELPAMFRHYLDVSTSIDDFELIALKRPIICPRGLYCKPIL